MSKDLTIQKLLNYESAEPGQSDYKNRILKFIQGNESCFDSEHPPQQGTESREEIGHITGSAWVLSPDKKSVLLTHHKKLNKWLQLGGHSDGETNVLLTARREAQEESGIAEITPVSEDIFDVDIHVFPKKKNVDQHLHYDIRFCFITEHTNFKISDESNNLSWVFLEKITPGQFDESLVRMAQKCKA